MVFSSLIFIFAFLPAFLLVYYLLPNRFRNLFIVVGGYFFYSWGAPRFAFVLLLTIFIDYGISHLFARCRDQKSKKTLLIVSILMNLGLLAYFKYSNFFVDQVNFLINLFHIAPMPWVKVILPIGISFTVFQELSYIIEVYRGKIKPARSVVDFAAYLMLFPHVIAGPIVRYIDIESQLRRRIHSSAEFFEGIHRFSLGLGKKILIANPMSEVADAIFFLHNVSVLSSPLAWLGIVAYAMQIYFDFSGYSDMAIGLAKMLGFDFKENFNSPYIARNITDFWRRWHISLSTWMREYLYIPLGGNRGTVIRTYLNLWIVFLISGLWHGSSWNFVIWGAFHGLILVLDKLFWLKISAKLPIFFNIAVTFVLVNIGWVFFRIENISEAWRYIGRLFDISTWLTPTVISQAEIISNKGVVIFCLALLVSFLPAWKLFVTAKEYFSRIGAHQRVFVVFGYSFILLLLSVMELVNAQFNPFIYFRF